LSIVSYPDAKPAGLIDILKGNRQSALALGQSHNQVRWSAMYAYFTEMQQISRNKISCSAKLRPATPPYLVVYRAFAANFYRARLSRSSFRSVARHNPGDRRMAARLAGFRVRRTRHISFIGCMINNIDVCGRVALYAKTWLPRNACGRRCKV
jgi:hypothetical protein